MVLGYDEGIAIEKLAKVLRLNPATVYEYLREYNSSHKTKSDPKGGSDSKLTKEQMETLLKHLAERTYLKDKQIVAYVNTELPILEEE